MRVKLGNYISEYSVRNKKSEDIPVYSVTNTQGFCRDYFGKEVASKDKSTYKIVPKGCFAYNPSRINVGSVDWQRNEERVIVSPLYNVFSVSEELDQQYLYYFLKSDVALHLIKAAATGSVRDNLKFNMLCDFQINLPSLNEQKEIVHCLDKIKTIIEHRQQQLQKLDELVKSRFIELFGDPRNNPNSFNVVSFNDCVEYMGDIGSNGANKVVVDHLDMKDEEDYALMVRFLNFTKNDFTDDVKYVSKEAYDFFKKSQIFGGELIICKIGSAGQNYVMPYLNRPVSLGLNQIMVRINNRTIMPYLYQYLNSDYGKQLIDGCINGAVTKSITKTELKKIPVIVPPIELQEQFATFVEQTDKSKFEIQQSLEKLETLKKALMQKYFG